MSKLQKLLLCWSVVALGAAEYIRHVHLSDKIEIAVGAAEVLIAVATGIAFGVATINKNSDTGPTKGTRE
jgi:hypothetical protein